MTPADIPSLVAEETHSLICELVKHMSDDLMFVVGTMPNEDQARFYALLDRGRQWLIDQADASNEQVPA